MENGQLLINLVVSQKQKYRSDKSKFAFIDILNTYLLWYNEKRIKKSLGYLSPMEYRHSLGLVV
ncbi:MAG: IS3 family transposase [Eubacterium sp.]|nr:IS3 family transposase [Eubacterium sp.]